jgi:hypothetical protein
MRVAYRRGTSGELAVANWLAIIERANGPIGSLWQCRQSGRVESAINSR